MPDSRLDSGWKKAKKKKLDIMDVTLAIGEN